MDIQEKILDKFGELKDELGKLKAEECLHYLEKFIVETKFIREFFNTELGDEQTTEKLYEVVRELKRRGFQDKQIVKLVRGYFEDETSNDEKN